MRSRFQPTEDQAAVFTPWACDSSQDLVPIQKCVGYNSTQCFSFCGSDRDWTSAITSELQQAAWLKEQPSKRQVISASLCKHCCLVFQSLSQTSREVRVKKVMTIVTHCKKPSADAAAHRERHALGS